MRSYRQNTGYKIQHTTYQVDMEYLILETPEKPLNKIIEQQKQFCWRYLMLTKTLFFLHM